MSTIVSTGPAVPPSKIRLARALVEDAQRRREREDKRIEQIARLPLPEDD